MTAQFDSFMQGSGYEEMAKAVHSTTASITTIFLFTRLWARSLHYRGLWWDDYLLVTAWALQLLGNGCAAASPAYGFRIHGGSSHGWTLTQVASTSLYLALPTAKTAFAMTLIRISSGKIKAILYITLAAMWAYSIVLTIVTWLNICGQSMVEFSEGHCVPANTLYWIHISKCIFAIFEDALFTALPWTIVAKVSVPAKERWAVGSSMSLVGFAGVIAIVRAAVAGYGTVLSEKGTDWTYGFVTIWCLFQAECAIYIIAQTVPLLRVLLQKEDREARLAPGSVAEITSKSRQSKAKGNSRAPFDVNDIDHDPEMELVVLPSGRVVRADSREGEAFKASQNAEDTQPTEAQPQEESSERDEVHETWAAMGLSKKAWSQSPSPQPEEGRHTRQASRNTAASPA